MNTRSVLSNFIRYLVCLAILVAAWHAAVALFAIPPYLLPGPSRVVATLTREFGFFAEGAAFTVTNMLVGGLAGITFGFLVGAVAAYSRRVRWVIEPYLTIFQSFPREALFPLLIVWLGFGQAPKMINAGLLSFFPMAIVTLHSLIDTREDYLRLMESWKASQLETYLYCRIPAAVPALVGGVRVSLPLALIGAVIGEFLGGSEGLGYIIVSSGSAFRVDRVFAAIVVLAVAGMALVAIVDSVRFTLLRHYYQR